MVDSVLNKDKEKRPIVNIFCFIGTFIVRDNRWNYNMYYILIKIFRQQQYCLISSLWFLRCLKHILEIKQSIKLVSAVWLLSMFFNAIISRPPLNELFMALFYCVLFINRQFQLIWILSVVDNEHNVVHLFDFPE